MASSSINGGGKVIENGVEEVKNTQPFDHWAFLDEIEAPMWFDLKSCDLIDEEIDDHWFHVSHPFHQCSSRQLVSTVFHSGEAGGSNSSFSIQEPPSPELPSSVSRSRGKIYKTKEWGQSRCNATSNKQHPVNSISRKSSGTARSSDKENPISRNRELTENECPKAGSSCESGLTDTSGSKISKSHSHYLAREGRQSSSSTITSDHNDHQQKKCLEVPGQTSSQPSGLLNSLRINLRKSCATRPAARVVVNDGRRSEGCKSSSSKSSVGSSLDQGSVSKKATLGDAQKKVKTPDYINVTRISQPPRNKLKVSIVSKARALEVQDISNRQRKDTLASKQNAKGKVQPHTLRVKVLVPRKVNEQNQMIDKKTEKVGVSKTAFLSGAKKSMSGTIASRQKPKSSDSATQGLGHVQRTPKQGLQSMGGSEKLVGLKAKTNIRGRGKDSTNAAQKVHFR